MLICSAFMLLATISFAQTWSASSEAEVIEAINKLNKIYSDANQMNVKITIESYKGHASKTPVESSVGFYKVSGDLMNSESMGILTVENKSAKIVVDKKSKIIGVYQKQKSNKSSVTGMDKNSLALAKSYLKRKNGSNTIFKITAKEGLKIEKVEFEIDASGFLIRTTNYFAQRLAWEDENGNEKKNKAKLSVKYNLISKKVSASSLSTMAKYVRFSGDQVLKSKAYSTFQISDFRVK